MMSSASQKIEAVFSAVGTDQFSRAYEQASRSAERGAGRMERAGGRLSGLLSKIGSAAKTFAKVGISALVGLTAGAINEGKKLEQSLGGIETMFKGSADTVIKNAERAYMTAGVSANDYMEQVTSFSATLLQGLDGDTAAAAKYADMAIQDMSDKQIVRLKRIEPYQGCVA